MVLFESFAEWAAHCAATGEPLWQPVLTYEQEQKGRTEAEIYAGIARAYAVMLDAIQTGLTEDMSSRSGLVNNSAKKVFNAKVEVLGSEFKLLLARTLAAKEVNSCMGRIVAAPTAGASGILPGILSTVQQLHGLSDETIYRAMLIGAGIGLIIEHRASISGAVGGCQAETGTAAAMGAGAVTWALGGSNAAVLESVAITIMNMLGLICDPIGGLVEVPCIKRNSSGVAIAFAAAQLALAGDTAMIPVDEVVDVMGEVGQAMDARYKETALGGLAATPTGLKLAENIRNLQPGAAENAVQPLL